MKLSLTDSDLLCPNLREKIEAQRPITVSGQPVGLYSSNGSETLYSKCEEIDDIALFVHSALVRTIDPIMNKHLGPEFTGAYLVIAGFTKPMQQGDGDEYVMGVRGVLNFAYC